MSVREKYPQAKLPQSHYFFSLARGETIRTYALRPIVLWGLIALAPLSVAWGACATLYIAFHDDMLSAIVARQAEMQYAYEDKLADARAETDRVASRQLLDQNSFEGKVHELLSRQATLEQRSSIVAALASEVAHDTTAEVTDPQRLGAGKARAATNALSAIQAIGGEPPTDSVDLGPARAFAPASGISEMPRAAKPQPVEEPREHVSANAAPLAKSDESSLIAAAQNPDVDAMARLNLVDYSLSSLERRQMSTLTTIGASAKRDAQRISAVVAEVGLDASKLVAPRPIGGVGGPYIPLVVDPKAPPFDHAVVEVAREVENVDKLESVIPYIPVRKPLIGEASVSSPFGYRPDPFLGRPELHPGVDLVQPYGAEIRATGAGRVTHAGAMGGYGEMVEIDHGNGLVTRYGHMSEVLVGEGQEVKQGAIIGRIGSTGRSTGPHLHYEVRVDGEPVDPERFLNAGVLAALR